MTESLVGDIQLWFGNRRTMSSSRIGDLDKPKSQIQLFSEQYIIESCLPTFGTFFGVERVLRYPSIVATGNKTQSYLLSSSPIPNSCLKSA